MKYRPEIDGLRALAVIPVIFYHAGFKVFNGGYIGVDIFFVISGYLITTIINSELESGAFSLAHFYERRARRILPALFLVMFACLPFSWFWLLPDAMKSFSESLIAVSIFASNILFWQTSGYFDVGTELKPLIHTWSLAVEEQYYVLFPLFLMLTGKMNRRIIAGILVFFFLISLVGAQWLSKAHPIFAFYMLLTRGWELLIGAFIALYYSHQDINKHKKKMGQLGSSIGLFMIFFAIFTYTDKMPLPSLYTLLPTLGASLIIIFANNKTVVGRLLGSKLFVSVGLISYSAYLWHQPIFAFARERSVDEPSVYLMTAFAALSFILARLSWEYAEKPFRNKNCITRKSIFLYGGLCSGLFIGIGVTGFLSDGYIDRFDIKKIGILEKKASGRLSFCNEELERSKGEVCIIGNKKTIPTIALIGDSHSTRLTKAFDEELSKNNLSAIVYAKSWCPPLIDIGTSNVRRYPICRTYMRNSYTEILSNKSIKTVVLVAEWANYTKGMRWGDETVSFYTDQQSLIESLQENIAVFQRALNRTKEALLNSGKKVIIVKTVPEYELLVSRAAIKGLFFNGNPDIPEKFKINHAKYLNRNSEVEDSFDMSNISEWGKVIEPYNILCIKLYCDYMDDEKNNYYVDSSHLTYIGSKKIIPSLLDYIDIK